MNAAAALRALTVAVEDSDASFPETLAALACTSQLALPVKPVLARNALRPAFRLETIDGFRSAVYAQRERNGASRRESLRFSASVAERLADALAAAEWSVTPRASDADPSTTPFRAALPWAATSFVTISPGESGFLRVSLVDDVLRAEHADAALALALFALQTSARLVLARPTLRRAAQSKSAKKADAERFLLGFDAVVPAASESVDRAVGMIAHAAAASDFARTHTLPSFRAIAASAAVARAYLESDPRFANIRSIGTEATPPATAALTSNEEENAPWTETSLI